MTSVVNPHRASGHLIGSAEPKSSVRKELGRFTKSALHQHQEIRKAELDAHWWRNVALQLERVLHSAAMNKR